MDELKTEAEQLNKTQIVAGWHKSFGCLPPKYLPLRLMALSEEN